MVFSCSACNRACGSSSGLTQHEAVCPKVAESLQESRRRGRELQSTRPHKRARHRQRSAAADDEASGGNGELPSNAIEPAASSLMVGSAPVEAANGAADFPLESTPDPPHSPPRSSTPVPPPPVALSAAGRPVRPRILPRRYQDVLPESVLIPRAAIGEDQEPSIAETGESNGSPSRAVSEMPTDAESLDESLSIHRSETNSFGLFHVYTGGMPTEIACANEESSASVRPESAEEQNNYAPYPNQSSYRLGAWFWNGNERKSQADFHELVKTIRDPTFNPRDLDGVNWHKIDKKLADSGPESIFESRDGWTTAPLKINVPFGLGARSPMPQEYTVEDFWYRPLLGVIRSVFESTRAKNFCYTPYELRVKPPSGAPECTVYGELYSSKAFRDAHQEVQKLAREENDNLPRAVAAMMFWSDGMAVANFGSAKLWPAYLQFGNESKYERTRPMSGACHHIAFLPSLPASIQDWIRLCTGGKGGKAELLTHCRRELMHAIWKLLLDDEFRQAWIHGIVVQCGDGVLRRLYPRIFTYAADYPEKVLLATMGYMALCPCPRCLVKKSDVHKLGTKLDAKVRTAQMRVDNDDRQFKVQTARRFIYELGRPVTSEYVKRQLQSQSLVPTENGFSSLAEYGFNVFSMLVPDEMHEGDSGVVRMILKHLYHILQAHNKDALNELNRRFRQTPPFGRDTVRLFSDNVSEMKQMTAHDWEDILQCAMPAFEGLLPPPHDNIVQDLLYWTAMVHGLSRLRMHTDSTIALLDASVSKFGVALRRFQSETCPAFATKELPQEAEARGRRQARRMASGKGKGRRNASTVNDTSVVFNINTYKVHAFGDYARTIVRFGTLDSYSTRIGESEHPKSKRRYERGNKVNFTKQVTEIERRQHNLHAIENALASATKQDDEVDDMEDGDELNAVDSSAHYTIGRSQRKYFHLAQFLREYRFDPAIAGQDFYTRLKDHLLARVLGLEYDGDERTFSLAERNQLIIHNDLIYTHKRLRVWYTKYDVTRDYDTLNPTSRRADIMVLSREMPQDNGNGVNDTNPPYWYARILGIFHVNVIHPKLGNYRKRMDLLWVRWYGRDPDWAFGNKTRRLERIGFVPATDNSAFGFLDPDLVIRAAHLLPAQSHGRTQSLLGPSRLARVQDNSANDWAFYYVGRWSDRDLLMHNIGGGVGHTTSRSTAEDLDTDDLNDEHLDDHSHSDFDAVSAQRDEAELDDAIDEGEGSQQSDDLDDESLSLDEWDEDDEDPDEDAEDDDDS